MIPTRYARLFFIFGAIFAFAFVAVSVLWIFDSILASAFGVSDREFTGLAGKDAAHRIVGGWPATVDPDEVQSASQKYSSSRDSHSTWYRVVLSQKAASAWQNEIHASEAQVSRGSLHHLHEGFEGVCRSERGPPPLHQQTGTTPAWWSPPAIDFRATEVMLWYKGYDSGVGRAAYSGYDESTKTLWIYEYGCQHDLLWRRGNVPAGLQFSLMRESAQGTAENDSSDNENADAEDR